MTDAPESQFQRPSGACHGGTPRLPLCLLQVSHRVPLLPTLMPGFSVQSPLVPTMLAPLTGGPPSVPCARTLMLTLRDSSSVTFPWIGFVVLGSALAKFARGF